MAALNGDGSKQRDIKNGEKKSTDDTVVSMVEITT
jgi:hypothetical protein